MVTQEKIVRDAISIFLKSEVNKRPPDCGCVVFLWAETIYCMLFIPVVSKEVVGKIYTPSHVPLGHFAILCP